MGLQVPDRGCLFYKGLSGYNTRMPDGGVGKCSDGPTLLTCQQPLLENMLIVVAVKG